MKNKKTTCFFNSCTFWGGGEKVNFSYSSYFIKENIPTCIFANPNSLLFKKASTNKIPVSSIKISNLSLFNPLKWIKLYFLYKKHNVNTVIFSLSQDLKIGSIIAKIARIKNIVYSRGLAVPIKNNFLNRFILTKCLTHIIANSEETKKTILKNFDNKILKNKVKVIYRGLNPQEYNTNDDSQKYIDSIIKKKQKGTFIIGTAGRLVKQKGLNYIIDIAKKLKLKKINFKILIAGTGELRQQLEQEIKKNNLEKFITLLGFITNIKSFMSCLDIFILCSLWEGFGFVLAEAMLFKRAVICFNISSNPEIVENNKTGFLIPPFNTDLFIDKIIYLKKNTSAKIEMEENAYIRFLNNFTETNQCEKFKNYIFN